MKITNIDLTSPAGHKILMAMDNLRVRIIAKNGIAAVGILAIHSAKQYPHVTLSVRDDVWEPLRIPRGDIEIIELLPEA